MPSKKARYSFTLHFLVAMLDRKGKQMGYLAVTERRKKSSSGEGS